MGYIFEEADRKGLAYIRRHLKPSRLAHTERVMQMAGEMALRYGEDPAKARTAALFHDMVRNLPLPELNGYVKEFGLDRRYLDQPNLSHGKIASHLMRRDFGIDDQDILNAVSNHTTGRAGMSRLEKIVFLSDSIEPGRSYPSVEAARALAEKDLDEACLFTLEHTVAYLMEIKGSEGEIDEDTLQALQDLKKQKEKEKC